MQKSPIINEVIFQLIQDSLIMMTNQMTQKKQLKQRRHNAIINNTKNILYNKNKYLNIINHINSGV